MSSPLVSNITSGRLVVERSPSSPSSSRSNHDDDQKQQDSLRLWSRPKITFRANCGCGFIAHTPGLAADHADEKGHTLSISGEIRVTKFV